MQTEPLTITVNVSGLALGYAVLNMDRTVYAAFTTTGMVEVGSTGVYAVAGGVIVPNEGGYIQVYKAPAGTEFIGEVAVGSISAIDILNSIVLSIKAKTDQLDTSSVTQVTTNLLGHLVITAGHTYTTEITGLTIPVNWEKIYWTVKQNPEDEDDLSTIQLLVSNPSDSDDGVLKLNASSPPTGLEDGGHLEVDQINGTVSINLSPELTVLLRKAGGRDTIIRSLGWDLKFIDSDEINTGVRGTIAIVPTETKATS